jgi:putative FmdB family regulatory protein
MPMYTYQCDKCSVQFDRLQSFSARPLTRCPECKGHVHRRLQPVGIVFKGSGWYSTDSRQKPASESEAETKAD